MLASIEIRAFLKYAIVGVLSNAVGYAFYVGLTFFQVAPKAAVTLLYVSTALLSFVGNKRLTFAYEGRGLATLIRYVIAQALGYLFNISILVVFVDRMGCDHRVVQACTIIVVAMFLFVLMKYFVFKRYV
jgi:putative flippase GtrA